MSLARRAAALVAARAARGGALRASTSGDFAAAAAALDRAALHAPEGDDAFERIEIAEVEAELALARGDARISAAALLAPVIARYADDDLAAREVRARLVHARRWKRSAAPTKPSAR